MIPRSMFHQCAIGGCDFWQCMKNDQGAILTRDLGIWLGLVNCVDLIRSVKGFKGRDLLDLNSSTLLS